MKRLLLPLIATVALATTFNANLFRRYGSFTEAKMACDAWRRIPKLIQGKNPHNREIIRWSSRNCENNLSTRQVLGFEKNFNKNKVYSIFENQTLPKVVKKRFRY